MLDLTQIAIYSIIASAISISLNSLHYSVQFFGSLTTVMVIHYVSEHFFDSNKKYVFQFFILALFSFNFVKPFFLSSLILLLLFFLLNYILKGKTVFLAFFGQLSDVISSFLVLPSGSELNPFTSFFIRELDIFQGLLFSKILFVLLPTVWAYYELEMENFELYMKFLFAVGFSLGVRNMTFFLQ